jgi:hypothetical protein
MMQFRDRVKQDFTPVKIPCKNCNLLRYIVKDFSDKDNSVIAHLECTNCESKDNFTINFLTEEFDEGLKSVKNSLDDLQKTIEDANR